MVIKRNDPCKCGSGKKYKKCCLEKDSKIEEITNKNILKQFDFISKKIYNAGYQTITPTILDELIEKKIITKKERTFAIWYNNVYLKQKTKTIISDDELLEIIKKEENIENLDDIDLRDIQKKSDIELTVFDNKSNDDESSIF